jgi:hypothetical protein
MRNTAAPSRVGSHDSESECACLGESVRFPQPPTNRHQVGQSEGSDESNNEWRQESQPNILSDKVRWIVPQISERCERNQRRRRHKHRLDKWFSQCAPLLLVLLG